MNIVSPKFLFSILCFLVSVLFMAVSAYAASPLLETYAQVLKDYQQDHDPVKAFSALQLAGIQTAIDKQPADIGTPDYVRLLNDYAFFRYQSVAFKDQVTATHPSTQITFTGNERMLNLRDISNPVMRFKTVV